MEPRIVAVCLLLGGLLVGPVWGQSGSGIAVPFGTGAGQVGYLNRHNTDEHRPIGHPLPVGPQAIRCGGGRAWVVDSLGGRILQFAADGRCERTIPVVSTASGAWLGDLAVKVVDGGFAAMWVVDRLEQRILPITADGQVGKAIGQVGDQSGQFLDLTRIELGPDGSLYAWDAAREVVAIFRADGTLVREEKAVNAGFALSADGTLCLGMVEDHRPTLRLRQIGAGLSERILDTDLERQEGPILWGCGADGGFLIGCGGASAETVTLVRLNPAGRTTAARDLAVPQAMVRPVAIDEAGRSWMASGDLDSAPDQALVIRQFGDEGVPQG